MQRTFLSESGQRIPRTKGYAGLTWLFQPDRERTWSSPGPIWGASRAAPEILTRSTHLLEVLTRGQETQEGFLRTPTSPTASSNQIFQLSGSQAMSISKLSSSSISSVIPANISGPSPERTDARTRRPEHADPAADSVRWRRLSLTHSHTHPPTHLHCQGAWHVEPLSSDAGPSAGVQGH